MSSKIAFLHIFNLPVLMPLKDEHFWKFSEFFFDSVQYVRYDPRQKFDADRKITGISAIFHIWPTWSCCNGVMGLSLSLLVTLPDVSSILSPSISSLLFPLHYLLPTIFCSVSLPNLLAPTALVSPCPSFPFIFPSLSPVGRMLVSRRMS
jgi:hypothetical protein